MTPAICTALGGTLERHPDGWRWSDGLPAAEVHDLRPSKHYNLRVRGGQTGYVEIPLGIARENDDLEWVIAGLRDHRFLESWDGDVVGPADRDLLSGRARPGLRAARVVLVPLREWDEWASHAVIGAVWAAADEAAILARARELGWRPEPAIEMPPPRPRRAIDRAREGVIELDPIEIEAYRGAGWCLAHCLAGRLVEVWMVAAQVPASAGDQVGAITARVLRDAAAWAEPRARAGEVLLAMASCTELCEVTPWSPLGAARLARVVADMLRDS